jgi:hypothetical protein
MLRHCIVAGSTVVSACLIASVITAGAVLAQTATENNPGRPLQLLQNIKPVKTAAHIKPAAASTAATSARKTKMAAKAHFRPHVRVAANRHPIATQMAQAVTRESAPPVSPPAAAANAVAMPSPSLEPIAPSAMPVPSELVVGGQEVRVASPDDVNEIDLAANNATASPSALAADPANAAAPAANTGEVSPKADAFSVAVAQQQQVSQEHSQEHSPIGSPSWIMQVVAALGGAVAAGSVAWFLIGSAPQRTYG